MKPFIIILSSVLFAGILLLILISEIEGDYYTRSTQDVHSLSIGEVLLIDSVELENYTGSYFSIQLKNNPEDQAIPLPGNGICIESSDLLQRKYRKRYPKNDGLIVISSEDLEIAARSWVILSRKGFENIRILNNKLNEKFNYSFQPDTTIGLK